MNSLSDEARYWAENLEQAEAEAFENAIKRIAPQKVIDMMEYENGELRLQLSKLADENRRLRDENKMLREAISRTQEEEWE